jgi:hypothetical protein
MLRFMPEPVVDGTPAVLGSPVPAEQQTSGDVEGRKAGTFTAWARRNVTAFR